MLKSRTPVVLLNLALIGAGLRAWLSPWPAPVEVAAAVDHAVGDKGVVTRGFPHVNVALTNIAEYSIFLNPATGTERHASRSRIGFPASVVYGDLDGVGTVVAFTGTDQGQVASILRILLQPVDPDTLNAPPSVTALKVRRTVDSGRWRSSTCWLAWA